jgi:hypothetical protein
VDKAYHSPPSSAKVKKAWSYISISSTSNGAVLKQIVFMTWYLVKHRDVTFVYMGAAVARSV